jgi:xanthine/uracil permease
MALQLNQESSWTQSFCFEAKDFRYPPVQISSGEEEMTDQSISQTILVGSILGTKCVLSFTDMIQEYIPSYLKQREIFVPLIVGFYVIVLGLALTGALRVSKGQQDKVRKERGSQFSMLDEDEDED